MKKDSVQLTVEPPHLFTLSGWDGPGKRATFAPSAELSRSTRYTVTVEGTDLAGNLLAGARAFSFTTAPPDSVPDTTPPTVNATAPSQASVGNPRDAVVLISFSEPMNRTSVEQAFAFTAPTDHDPAGLTFTWNDEGTQVTVDPAVDFPYDVTVGWSLSTGALDVSGNSLTSPVTGEFRIARLVSVTVVLSARNSATMRSDQYRHASGGHFVGDSSTGEFFQVFLSYDVSNLVVGSRIASANLVLHHSYFDGFPFNTLGNLLFESVDYGDTLDDTIDDFFTPALGTVVALTKNQYTYGPDYIIRVPVTSLLTARVVDAGSQSMRVQIRMRFANGTDSNNSRDMIFFSNGSGDPRLELTIESP